jgi:hypothetical protein
VGHIAIAKVCGGSRLLFPAAVVKMRQRGIFFACANGGKQLITGDSDSAENCSVSGAPVRRRWEKEWWSGECVAEQRARRKSSCLYWGGEGEKGLKLQRLGKRNLSAAQHNRLHHKKTPTATDGGPRTLFSARTVSIKVAVLPIPKPDCGDKPYHPFHSICDYGT